MSARVSPTHCVRLNFSRLIKKKKKGAFTAAFITTAMYLGICHAYVVNSREFDRRKLKESSMRAQDVRASFTLAIRLYANAHKV